MKLTVGEIAKVLGLTTENIRYYVREGLITPDKNEENNYWEYSSEDLWLILDILFYRDMGFSINNIRAIFDGLPLDEIGNVIEATRGELIEKILEYAATLKKVEDWSRWYKEELSEIGKYSIGYMPATLRISKYFDQSEHLAKYLKDGICIHKDDLQRLSICFLYNYKDDKDRVQQYICMEKNEFNSARNFSYDVLEEKSCLCLMTHALYTENIHDIAEPLIKYAEENNIELTGEIIGRERTNYYVENHRRWVWAIYAPIKKK